MALLPFVYRDNWGAPAFAQRFFDDDFGCSFFGGELVDPAFFHRRFYLQPSHGGRSDLSSGTVAGQPGSAVACSGDKFAINVDTRHFTPEEVTVKTQDNCVIIHGKHEEKSDDHGCYVKREFTRRYVLPEDVDPETVKCHLTPGGYLSLEAPRKNAPKKDEAKPIPIEVRHETSGAVSNGK